MSPSTCEPEDDRRVTISLPDLFQGFLVGDPLVNSHYDIVRVESEKWLQADMSLSPGKYKRVRYCDFSYFCAVLVPHASQEKLKIVCDWGNWVFLFDDSMLPGPIHQYLGFGHGLIPIFTSVFDEGELTNDPQASRSIINNLLSTLLPEVVRSSAEPVVTAHDSIYERFKNGSKSRTVQRYITAMTDYCEGALQHVEDHVADRIPDIAEMLETRRKSIGVFPMYPLIEFAYDLAIPDEVFSHPTIQALENLGAEMNDILSYQKEEGENCPFNMVAVCRMNGSSAQEAFDELASLIDERFAQWETAMNMLPVWGGDIDSQVQLYIQGIQNIVQANLSWR
ncbi:hypothetical protein CIB48_g3318 [Xylaria polymorpha]|nr:hypothetical protein CIB48_g3318 [Xylaria polymorpha]